MFNHTTHLHDWLLPILLIPLGGFLAIQEPELWLYAGIGMWAMSLIIAGWLSACSIYNEAAQLERERTDKVEADIKLYELLQSMLPDEKIQYGLGSVKETVRLEIIKEEGHVGKYQILSISPAKLRAIAYACTQGTPFSMRSLAGAGKILTDNEYYKLRDELVQYELLSARSEKNERQGYYWTNAGRDFLQEVINNPIIKGSE